MPVNKNMSDRNTFSNLMKVYIQLTTRLKVQRSMVFKTCTLKLTIIITKSTVNTHYQYSV